MMGKINQRYPYSLRVSLLAAMDLKTAQRGFTSWDRDNVGEHVMLVTTVENGVIFR
jgi:hypothetical protein